MSMTPSQIRRSLHDGGWTLQKVGALAPDGPMSKAMISRNINKKKDFVSYRAQVAIAKALDLPCRDVFGPLTVAEPCP